MRLAHREELPSRIVSRQFVVQLIGLSHGSAVKHIGSRDFVSCREFMIHPRREVILRCHLLAGEDRKSTRLNSSHTVISYAVFCLKKKKKTQKSTLKGEQ